MSGTRLRGDYVATNAKQPALSSLKEAEEGASIVKDQLIDKLIEENKGLLVAIDKSKEQDAEGKAKIRREAGLLMSRLLQDNSRYRKENQLLNDRLIASDRYEAKARQQLSELLKTQHDVAQERRMLQRYLDTLREDKINLEYQVKHLGAAFLTLRDAVIQLSLSPVALEAETDELSWESRVQTSQFQTAVIQTVQICFRLRAIMIAIDQRLISLRLLDASAASSSAVQPQTLHLMGERLIPEKDLAQVKKERQLWQRRYTKCQEDVVRFNVEVERLSKGIEQKEQLLKKAVAEKAINRTAVALRASLRAHNIKLQEEVKRLTETLAESQRQLGIVRRVSRQEKERPVSVPPAATPRAAESFLASAPSTVQPLTKAVSRQFLGSLSTSRRPSLTSVKTTGRIEPIQLIPPKDAEEQSVVSLRTARTLRSPAKAVVPLSSEALPETQRQKSVEGSVKSHRTLRSPSRLLPAPVTKVAPPVTTIKAPSVEESTKHEPSFGEMMHLAPSKRGIGTTVTQQSDYQTPLGREIAALARIREAEARDTSMKPEIEIEAKTILPMVQPVSPIIESHVEEKEQPRKPFIEVKHVKEDAKAVSEKRPPLDFLAVGSPRPIEKKPSQGKRIGRRKEKTDLVVPVAEVVPRQRSGISIGGRGRQGKDTELNKELARSFFSPDTSHRTSPSRFIGSPYLTPRLDEVSLEREATLSEVTSCINTILDLSYDEENATRLHSSDLSSVLQLLESIPSK